MTAWLPGLTIVVMKTTLPRTYFSQNSSTTVCYCYSDRASTKEVLVFNVKIWHSVLATVIVNLP